MKNREIIFHLKNGRSLTLLNLSDVEVKNICSWFDNPLDSMTVISPQEAPNKTFKFKWGEVAYLEY
jgi:hypothetical protein